MAEVDAAASFFEVLRQLQDPVDGWSGAAARHAAAVEGAQRDAAVLQAAAALLRDLIAVYEAFTAFDDNLRNLKLIAACDNLQAASFAAQAAQAKVGGAGLPSESLQCLAAASLELLQRRARLEATCVQLLRQAMPRPHSTSTCLSIALHVLPSSAGGVPGEPVGLHELFAAATRLQLVTDWAATYAAAVREFTLPLLLADAHAWRGHEETVELSPDAEAASAAGTWHYRVFRPTGETSGDSSEGGGLSTAHDNCAHTLAKVCELGRFLRGAVESKEREEGDVPHAASSPSEGSDDTTVATEAAISRVMLELWFGASAAGDLWSPGGLGGGDAPGVCAAALCELAAGACTEKSESDVSFASTLAAPARGPLSGHPVFRLADTILSQVERPAQPPCCLLHAVSRLCLTAPAARLGRTACLPATYHSFSTLLQRCAEAEALWTRGGAHPSPTPLRTLASSRVAPLLAAAVCRFDAMQAVKTLCNDTGAEDHQVPAAALLDDIDTEEDGAEEGATVRVSGAALGLANILSSLTKAFSGLVTAAAGPNAAPLAAAYAATAGEGIEAFLLLAPIALPAPPAQLLATSPALAARWYCDCLYLAGTVFALPPLPAPAVAAPPLLPLVRRLQRAAHAALVIHVGACRTALLQTCDEAPSWTEVALEEDVGADDVEPGTELQGDGILARSELCLRDMLLMLARWRQAYSGTLPPNVSMRLMGHYADVVIARRVNEVLAAGDIGEDAGRGLAGLLRRLLEGAAHLTQSHSPATTSPASTSMLPHLALIARLEADAAVNARIRSWGRALATYHLLVAPLATILTRVAGGSEGPAQGYDAGLTRSEAGRLVRAVFQPSVTRTAVLSALAAH